MWKIILIILVILYILNPYDLVSDFLAGWGWLDDLVVLGFLLRYLHGLKKKRQVFQNYDQTGRQKFQDDGAGTGDNYSRPGDHKQDASSPWDPYRVLEIERGASQESIKKAYRQLAGKYHPDKVAHLGDEFRVLAENRFKQIQRAYDELKSQ